MTAPANEADDALRRLVLKNTLFLAISQALTVPLAVLMNVVLARYLGPSDVGYLYLASTYCGFAFLAINWGQDGALPQLVARERSQSGALLGTSVAWRIGLSFVVYVVLACACYLLHYDAKFHWALGLTFILGALNSLVAACKDSIRGFERTDIPAATHVGQQLLTTVCVVLALVLGGGLRTILITQIPVCLLVLIMIWRTLRPVGFTATNVSRGALTSLLALGSPFVFFSLAMTLQPTIDAFFLSKMSSTEVIGWFAVSSKLRGVLLFPATAMIGALYPTLCRLFAEDMNNFAEVSRGAFRGVALLAVPIAFGCALYPDVGVSIFNRNTFGPAEDNLRVSSVFLFLVYFSMPLGTCVVAAGRNRAWGIVQATCVVVSLALDPVLIPWLQKHKGNGGLGVCIAGVISEVIVVSSGMALLPKGVIDRKLMRTIFLALLSGGAMVVFAWATRRVPSFAAAPASVIVYAAALWATGGIEKDQIDAGVALIRRKLKRA